MSCLYENGDSLLVARQPDLPSLSLVDRVRVSTAGLGAPSNGSPSHSHDDPLFAIFSSGHPTHEPEPIQPFSKPKMQCGFVNAMHGSLCIE